MQPERRPTDQDTKGNAGRVAWSLLAIMLILFPLIAVGRIMVATEDELADVRAQAVAEMAIEHRNLVLTHVTSFGWDENPSSHTRYLTYDCAVLKVNARIALNNVDVDRIAGFNYSGFWTNTGGWDQYIGRSNIGDTQGGSFPQGLYIMDGLRIELAYDDIDSPDRRFLFFRFGTDNVRGRMNFWGHLNYLSFDGILDNNLEDLLGFDVMENMRMNNHRQTLAADIIGMTPHLTAVNYMDFALNSSSGASNFYVSIADTITTRNGGSVTTNDGRAIGPWASGLQTIPGRGLWMHLQRGYVNANLLE